MNHTPVHSILNILVNIMISSKAEVNNTSDTKPLLCKLPIYHRFKLCLKNEDAEEYHLNPLERFKMVYNAEQHCKRESSDILMYLLSN